LDESITLSSAMLLAGYPSVVGSLWRVEDEYCPTVTKEVYRCMLGEDEKLDIRRSAEGLHRAVRCLREKTTRAPGFQINAPSKPLVWASFIHLGV
jgi:CHAT domain-containing protein